MGYMPRKTLRLSANVPRPQSVKGWSDEALGNFYRCKAWRATRSAVLASEPLCRSCRNNGIITTATMVDHIQPIRLGGERLAFDNLQPLCNKCHELKTREEKKLK